MFQTEPILFLQSFANPVLNYLFLAVTRLGNADTVKYLLISIIFGLHFRKGFALLHFTVWTAFVTGMMKTFFALPRPFYVDAAVHAIGRHISAPTPLLGMGGNNFWNLPDVSAIEYVRKHPMGSFGFPSGHTSGAVAVWGGLSLLFQKKWVWWLAGMLMVLIPFSRIYLGRHFIADVLGGYLLGGFLVLMIFQAYRLRIVQNFLFSGFRLAASNREIFLGAGYLFGLPLAAMLAFQSHPTYPALLLGLNLGFFLVWSKGLPDESGSVVRRAIRVVTAGIIFILLDQGMDRLLTVRWVESSPFLSAYVAPVVLMALFVWTATEINIVLGFMHRNSPISQEKNQQT